MTRHAQFMLLYDSDYPFGLNTEYTYRWEIVILFVETSQKISKYKNARTYIIY